MATAAHSLFCFETLVAALESRDPLSLKDVQRSYAEYLASEAPASSILPTKQPPAMRRVVDASGSLSASSGSSSGSSSSVSSSYASAATSSTSLGSTAFTSDPVQQMPPSPLFVTWNISERGDEPVLRGCIGTFEAQPLASGLATYALTAAFDDTRFRPVAQRELPFLEVAVTLLTDFEAAADVEDWTLGTHGLRISFRCHGRRLSATYLPDVAPEQGWTKEETVVSLMRKAGWSGRRDTWREIADNSMEVVRYQGRKCSLPYATYKRWRDWADAQAKP